MFKGACNSESEDNDTQQSSASNAVVYTLNHNWSETAETPITLTSVPTQVATSSPTSLPGTIITTSSPTTAFMNWYTAPDQSYQLSHHHHHHPYQPLEYVSSTIAQTQPEYIYSDLQKPGETPPLRESTSDYDCGVDQRLFPKSNSNEDICLIKHL